jgi:hypothetical protein
MTWTVWFKDEESGSFEPSLSRRAGEVRIYSDRNAACQAAFVLLRGADGAPPVDAVEIRAAHESQN